MHITQYIIGLSLSFMLSVAHATDLPIGSVSLSLGMDQSTVMKELHEHFHVIPVTGNKNMFFVSESKLPNAYVIGGVSFENGRLSWIRRNWGSFSGQVNPVAVSEALFSAVDSARASSGGSAAVSTSVQRTPGAEFKSIYFTFPGRKITVFITDGDAKYGQQVSIDESVSVKP